jgi:hypothetical protein
MLAISLSEKGLGAFSFTEKMANSISSLTGYIGREILYLAVCAAEGRMYTADDFIPYPEQGPAPKEESNGTFHV